MCNGFGALWHSSLVGYRIYDSTGNFKQRATPQWLSIRVPADILAVFSACAVQIVALHICSSEPSKPDIAGFFLLTAFGIVATLVVSIFDKRIGQLPAKATAIAERISSEADVLARRSKKSAQFATQAQMTAASPLSSDAVRLPEHKLQKGRSRFVLNATQQTTILERCRGAIDILAGCIDHRRFVDRANRTPLMAYRHDPWYVCLCYGKIPTERYPMDASPDLKVARTVSLRREVVRTRPQGI